MICKFSPYQNELRFFNVQWAARNRHFSSQHIQLHNYTADKWRSLVSFNFYYHFYKRSALILSRFVTVYMKKGWSGDDRLSEILSIFWWWQHIIRRNNMSGSKIHIYGWVRSEIACCGTRYHSIERLWSRRCWRWLGLIHAISHLFL